MARVRRVDGSWGGVMARSVVSDACWLRRRRWRRLWSGSARGGRSEYDV